MSDPTPTPASPANSASTQKDDDYKVRTLPVVRKCTQEEYEAVVQNLTKDLKPYQNDMWRALQAFNDNKEQDSLDFPPTLTSNERQTVHHLADIFGMTHESSGRGQKRFIRCEKRKDIKIEGPSFTEMYYFKGYIGIMGSCVDCAANQSFPHIPKEYIESRVKRDGLKHHITILTKKELKTLASKGDDFDEDAVTKILTKLSEEVLDDWEDMGLGRTMTDVNGDVNEAYYKVVNWDSANKFRKDLGLPEKHFHITVGFKTDDIHEVNKDISTLVTLLETATL